MPARILQQPLNSISAGIIHHLLQAAHAANLPCRGMAEYAACTIELLHTRATVYAATVNGLHCN